MHPRGNVNVCVLKAESGYKNSQRSYHPSMWLALASSTFCFTISNKGLVSSGCKSAGRTQQKSLPSGRKGCLLQQNPPRALALVVSFASARDFSRLHRRWGLKLWLGQEEWSGFTTRPRICQWALGGLGNCEEMAFRYWNQMLPRVHFITMS